MRLHTWPPRRWSPQWWGEPWSRNGKRDLGQPRSPLAFSFFSCKPSVVAETASEAWGRGLLGGAGQTPGEWCWGVHERGCDPQVGMAAAEEPSRMKTAPLVQWTTNTPHLGRSGCSSGQETGMRRERGPKMRSLRCLGKGKAGRGR